MSVLTEEQKEKLQALQQEKATRCAEKFSKRDQEK
jgi:Spy/CpxP family protein refolding chaperone